ncbi:MAG: galactose oxidase-like domain-containing protein, partial [Solirubrobacteraceae bacterium]
LTPRERATRIATPRRQTAALNSRIAERTRDDVGYWEPGLRALPEYAIHASMLPTGKVLIFGREPLVGGTRSNRGSASLFDPATGQSKHLPPPPIAENPDGSGGSLPAAIFCAGQALLSDGRVLVAGGNLAEPAPDQGRPQYSGLDHTFIFDPWSETWQAGPRMSHGRWYPTLAKLASGDVIIASGLDEDGKGAVNPQLDLYRPGEAGVTRLAPVAAGERGPAIGTGIQLSLYPGLFLLPDANVALAGPAQHDSALLDTAKLQRPGAARGSAWMQIPSTTASQQHYGGSPVLEPRMDAFGGSWSILVTAGADSNGGVGFFPARTTVDRLVAGPGEPFWSHDAQDDFQQARFYPNLVLLPDGGIIAIGGGLAGNYTGAAIDANYYVGDPPPPALRQVELRRPGERGWRLGAAQQEYRTYHSTAALLPDGRVMSAGDDGHEGPLDAPVPPEVRRDSAEIYWPPYLFDGDQCALRPVIRGVGSTTPPAAGPAAVLTYGEQFGIFSEHARPGMQAALVAPAAVTHGVDSNQRVVPLRVAATVPGGGLNALTPANAAIAPPGYYMLVVVDAAGTPSQARWV